MHAYYPIVNLNFQHRFQLFISILTNFSSVATIWANGAGMAVSGGGVPANAYGIYATQPTIGSGANYAGFFSGSVDITSNLVLAGLTSAPCVGTSGAGQVQSVSCLTTSAASSTYAALAGAIFTGNVIVNGTSNTPFTVNQNASSGYPNPANFFGPNTPTGHSVSVSVGVAPSTNNAGQIILQYAGAGSSSNFLQLQVEGTGVGGMNIYGDGHVSGAAYINATTYFSVNGTAGASKTCTTYPTVSGGIVTSC